MEQKKKMIGTTEYLVTEMDAISALKIQTKIIKVIGPGVAGIAGKKLDSTKDLVNFLPAVLPALMENFDDIIVNEIVLALFAKGVMVQKGDHSEVVDFSEHFRGNLSEMWKVAAFIMEVNFAMGELFGSILPTTQKVKKTQDSLTSTLSSHD